ncbi:rRNA-processing protein and EBNA1-binding protein ebp2 [Tulasnella sp. 419]|nr:rRNA-processing protein and EBNA1-binding protein ebp2 [Tulasnella sp. 419]
MGRNKIKENSTSFKESKNGSLKLEKSVKSSKGSKVKVSEAPIESSSSAEDTGDGQAEPLDSEDEDEDSETGGVGEMGMNRLLSALGEDGLDEFDLAQLHDDESEDENESGSDEDKLEEEDGENDSDLWQDDESESSEDDEQPNAVKQDAQNNDRAVAGDESDEEIALDEIDGEVDEDVIPRQKIEINNEVAIKRIRESIKLDPTMSWTETLTVTYPTTLDVTDPDDDLQRELAFYKQALHGAEQARKLAQQHSLPFTRPSDYFAEMVKSDAHMERIRVKLLDETASIKKSEQAKKQRDLKKFGKQVQVEKQKERDRSRKEIEEKVKGLKRKRKDAIGGATGGDEDFDVAVEEAIGERPAKRHMTNGSRGGKAGGSKRGMPRNKRDAKFRAGGGGGRHSKSNTKDSTNDFEFAGGGKFRSGKQKRGQGNKPKRLGKSRRAAGRK